MKSPGQTATEATFRMLDAVNHLLDVEHEPDDNSA
jgi:hypothetical protein